MPLAIAIAIALIPFHYADAVHNVKTAARWVGKAAKQTGCVVTRLKPCAARGNNASVNQ